MQDELSKQFGERNFFLIRDEIINEISSSTNNFSFTITDIFDALNNIQNFYFNHNDEDENEPTSFKDRLFSRFKKFLYDVFQTILGIIDDIVLLFISVCIIVNLQLRSEYPSGLFYPNNENKFPYVFFDSKNNTYQPTLVTTNITKNYNIGENVFIDLADNIGAKNTNSDNNYCSINDPYNITKKCGGKETQFQSYLEKHISYENMDFFSKKFIDSNKSKSSKELTIYGLISYIMAYTSCNVNGNMQLINELFNPIMNMTFCDKPFIFNKLLSFLFIWVFYNIFKNNVTSIKNVFRNLIFKGNNDKDNIEHLNISIHKLLDIVSSIFSPFLVFFKLLFLMIYPMVSIHTILGFMNYSSYTPSYFIKAFCYYGIVLSMILCVGLTTMFINMLKSDDQNINTLFDKMYKDFKDILNNIKNSLVSEQSNLKDDLSAFQENFIEGACDSKCKRIKKKKKEKKKASVVAENTEEMARSWAVQEMETNQTLDYDYNDLGYVDETVDKSENVEEDIQDDLGPENRTEEICKNLNNFQSGIGQFIKIIIMIIIIPITALLLSVPMMISLFTTIHITKSITLDYIYYVNDLFCKMSHSSNVIRIMFYILIFHSMIESTSVIEKIILGFFIVFDVCRMQQFWENLCKLKSFF